MAKAPIEQHVVLSGFEDVEAGIVKWPLSVLRIRHKDSNRLVDLATHVLEVWRGYTDEAAFIYAETNGEPHNTITPIARKVGDIYELDLTLRNNITTEEHPLGVYHPHAEYHHIKKENIGLIEVMGLAVLPARLKGEMELLEEYILEGKDIFLQMNRLRNMQSGLRSSFRNIRKSQKKTSMAFFRKRLESYLPMFWKTQEYTNVRPREEKHLCVFLKHYKN